MMRVPDERDWRILLGEIGETRLRLTDAAPAVFPLSAPHLGASAEQVAEAETRLGTTLDPQHRALLLIANGWPDLLLEGRLLSTEELGQGPVWAAASERLDLLYRESATAELPPRDELMPIFVSDYQPDVFAIWTRGPQTNEGHPVLWTAFELVDRWANVHEWWLALTAIAKRHLEQMNRLNIADI